MTFFDLTGNDGFRAGLAVGALTLVVAAAIGLVTRSKNRSRGRRRRPGRKREPMAPIAGVAFAVAGVIAIDATFPRAMTDHLLTGLVLLAVGPTLAVCMIHHRLARVVAALAAIPGAIVVGEVAADVNQLAWVEALVVVAIVGGGLLATDLDRFQMRAGLGPVLLAVTVAGCYVTLPDTEYIATLLGAVLPLALLGFPIALASLGPGTYVALGVLGWVAAVEGAGRASAVVGAFACLGVLALEPIVRRALGRRSRVLSRPVAPLTIAVIALQCGIVAVTSRIAGLESSASRAGIIALGAWVLGAILLAALLYQRPPASAPTSTSTP